MKAALLFTLAIIFFESIAFAQTGDYYPLEVDNYWIYKSSPINNSDYQQRTDRITVERTDVVNGNKCFKIGSINLDTGDANASHWVGKDNEGNIIDYALGTDTFILTEWDPPHVVIPNNIVNGISWENRIKGYNEEYPDSVVYAVMSSRVESTLETVTVPAGTFDNCLKIRMIFTNYDGVPDPVIVMYYAKGIGRIMSMHEKPGEKAFRKEIIEYGIVK